MARVGAPLVERLVKEGLLTPEQAGRVLAEQRKTNERLITVLRRLDLVSDRLFEFLSRHFDRPIVDLRSVEVGDEVTRLVRKELADRYGVFPVRKVGDRLTLAVSDPMGRTACDGIQFATGLKVVPVLAPEAAIRDAIDRHYGSDRLNELIRAGQADADAVQVVDRASPKVDLTAMSVEAGEAPVIRLVNLILEDAIRKRASDIHLEPFEKVFRIRYRIDGVLHDVMAPPKAMEAATINRIKILAGMDIAERRRTQRGRISVKLGEQEVDLRASLVPGIFGEKVVLRILDKAGVVLDLQKLGFEADDLERFERLIRSPHGMVLVTGPTGSGKSTTLYSAIATINFPDINIMTAEDPVEYDLVGVNQVQVHEDKDVGVTFAEALREFLRQDPDVILIGEIRDRVTARIAIRAALTGHLVFSTLHTNDAASSVTRLVDMGVAPFLVSSSLLVVVAQRLCRRICGACQQPAEVALGALLEAGFRPDEAESVKVYRGAGCPGCGNTGFRGRTGIHEILYVTPELQEAILRRRPANELKEIAVRHGMRTLRQAGLRKVAAGVTTLDEVMRVTLVD